jgi:hypothetical protein
MIATIPIEESIVSGVKEAQRKYVRMSSRWLNHAPEYFLTSIVADTIHRKTRRYVYMDVSPNRLYKYEFGMDPRDGGGIRPDISVWNQNENAVEVCIEIKRAYSLSALRADAQRILTLVSHQDCERGYIIAFSTDARSLSTYRERHEKWAASLGWNLVTSYTYPKDDYGYYWGFCLLRCPSS